MKLSFSWLTDFVDLSGITPEILADKMTMNAFEVERIETFGADLTGPIVIGEIVDIQAHPDPKVTKMRLTKVKVDDKQEPLEIVCGASNIAVGQRIPVALVGSVVINRHDGTAFPILAMEKRGVRSNGMLCAPSELGITWDPNTEGILILDPTLANRLGADAQKLLCLEKDYVLSVGSRSNRGDAVSVRGMAREVAALFDRPMHEPDWQLIENDNSKSPFSVHIADTKDCEYFSIRALSNIKVTSSPPFIANRLAAVGSRPINNLVDITNYVMHEWGQPLHAYDARYVKDGKFSTRRGQNGETFVTLDGKERILTEEALIVADPEKVIGMPVMGGANSEIRNDTTEIALEAASFNSAQVRRTSRLLGLGSESGLRFERGVDLSTTKQASDRAAYLIAKYCGTDKAPVKVGTFVAGGKDQYTPIHVDLRLNQVKRYLNLDLSATEIKTLLGRLGFTATNIDVEKITFAIPSFRKRDVLREIDLIEEVCRLYGYNNIKDESPAFFAIPKMPDNIKTVIRNAFVGQGFCEAFISSLVPHVKEAKSPKDFNIIFSPEDQTRLIEMRNPISEEHQVMRQGLLPGLIKALKYNHDRSIKDAWLFELGYVYFKHNKSIKSEYPADEKLKVAGALVGSPQLTFWHTTANETDFYTAKGSLQNLFIALGIPIDQIKYMRPDNSQKEAWLLHPGQSAKIVFADRTIGWLGQLHPQQAQNLDLDPSTYLFELDVEILDSIRVKPGFKNIPNLPPVSRDITVDVPENTENITVINCIKEAANHLRDLDLVSTFPLGNGLTSLSYRIILQSEAETFKNEEVEQIMNNVRKNLKEKLSASFRG